MRRVLIAAIAAFTLLGSSEYVSAQEVPLFAGEIKKIDVDAGKVTIKHDAIPNLDRGSMTMAFKARSPEC